MDDRRLKVREEIMEDDEKRHKGNNCLRKVNSYGMDIQGKSATPENLFP